MKLEDALRLSRIHQAKSCRAEGYIIGNRTLNMDALLFEPDPPPKHRRKLGNWIGLDKLGIIADQIRSLDDWEPLQPIHPLEALAREAEDDNGEA